MIAIQARSRNLIRKSNKATSAQRSPNPLMPGSDKHSCTKSS